MINVEPDEGLCDAPHLDPATEFGHDLAGPCRSAIVMGAMACLLAMLSPGDVARLRNTSVGALERLHGADGRELAADQLPVQVAARGGRVRDFEERIVFEDGSEVALVGNAVPLLDAKGRSRGSVAAFVDATALKQTEQELTRLNETLERRVAEAVAEREVAVAQLHEMQKLETIGQLTGGIAHDFNNLLTPIVGSLDIIRRRLGSDERSQRLIGGAQEAAERARVLVSRLLTFARRQHLEPRAVDIGEIVTGMEELVARTIGPQVAIKLDLAPDLPPVRVDPNQLELALLNLAVNARDAMPGGGRIAFASDLAAPGEDREHGLAPGRYVRLCVIDTGCGMDAGTLRRAVEPFFSTKGVGKGTGLGLSMVHGLAAQSGGTLQLRSAAGEGTTATIWLPVAEEGATSAAKWLDEPDAAIPHTRSLSVLLVDDEELVRMATADMLADLGHVVRQAASGAQALDILTREGGVELLVTDYAMPGMTGAELARAARALRPGLPVLVITGYANLAEDVGRGLPRLAKPFRQADLAAHIAELAAGEVVSLPARPAPRLVT